MRLLVGLTAWATIMAAMPTQTIWWRTLRVAQQTADSAVVVVSWTQSNSDSVRVAWTYPGASTTRVATGARRADTLRVAKGSTTQTASVTLTPKRGAVTGSQRSASIVIPARPAPPVPSPSIDSIRVDTTRSAPVVVVPPPDTTPPVVVGPPATPTAFAPNLPAGMVLVAESSFENFVTGSRDADGIEIINWSGNTTEDAASFGVRSVACNGGYGSRCIRTWFPGNHAGDGVGPLTMMVSNLNSRAHYMVTRMRYSPNHRWHSNGEKLFYPVQAVAGQTWGAATLNVGSGGQLMGVSGPIQAAPVGEPKTPPNVIPIGPWFTVEFFAEMNTPGQANGTWQAWVNGVRVMNVTNWTFSNNPTQQMLFTLARQDMTRGGGPSSVLTPPEGVWVEVDRLAFYKR